MSEVKKLIAEARVFDTAPAPYATRLLGAHSLIGRLADALEESTRDLDVIEGTVQAMADENAALATTLERVRAEVDALKTSDWLRDTVAGKQLEAILDSAPPVARALPNREQLAVAIMAALDELWVSDGQVLGKLHTRDEILAAIGTAPPVSDDTEWEYGVIDAQGERASSVYPSLDVLRQKTRLIGGYRTMRRRKAGPWVAIEKGGESDV